MPPRTIDNLGPDVSRRYAEDQNYDKSIITEAGQIPLQTQVDVTAPFFPSEIESLLEMQPQHLTWGYIVPPKGFDEQRKRLFTSQIMPTVTPDKIEMLIERVAAVAV